MLCADVSTWQLDVHAQGRSNYVMPKLVDDAVGVIKHLGYEKCVLVGHGELSDHQG